MTKKKSMAALKAAGYSMMNPPVPASDYYPAYLILKAKCAGYGRAEKAQKWKQKKASRDILTNEEMEAIREKRRAKRKQYRDNMMERFSKKSELHDLPSQAKMRGKTVTQLIVESWDE